MVYSWLLGADVDYMIGTAEVFAIVYGPIDGE